MSETPFTRASFETFLADGKLMGTRSKATGKIFVPPRPLDPETHSEEMEWVELSGRGTLTAFTSIFIGPSAMIAAGYDRTKPYLAGIVELEEGPLISAQILGLDAEHPDIEAIGTSLNATFVTRGEGESQKTYLVFSA